MRRSRRVLPARTRQVEEEIKHRRKRRREERASESSPAIVKTENDQANETKDNPTDKEKSKEKVSLDPGSNLGALVYHWYRDETSKDPQVTDEVIYAKALEMSKGYEVHKTVVRMGAKAWLKSWKEKCDSLHQEQEKPAGSVVQQTLVIADYEDIKRFRGEVSSIIVNQGLSRDQVFYMEEMELFFKAMPRRFATELQLEQEMSQSVSVFVCVNASGTFKVPLFVVEKLNDNEVDSDCELDYNQVVSNTFTSKFYRVSRSSHEQIDYFKKWYQHDFTPRVLEFLEEQKLTRKILLVSDMSHSHVNVTHRKDFKLLLTSSSNILGLPVKQWLMKEIKRKYCMMLLNSIVECNRIIPVGNCLKNLRVETAIEWLETIWINVGKDSVASCWDEIWPKAS